MTEYRNREHTRFYLINKIDKYLDDIVCDGEGNQADREILNRAQGLFTDTALPDISYWEMYSIPTLCHLIRDKHRYIMHAKAN